MRHQLSSVKTNAGPSLRDATAEFLLCFGG
jgi:hypothetical protein